MTGAAVLWLVEAWQPCRWPGHAAVSVAAAVKDLACLLVVVWIFAKPAVAGERQHVRELLDVELLDVLQNPLVTRVQEQLQHCRCELAARHHL